MCKLLMNYYTRPNMLHFYFLSGELKTLKTAAVSC